MTTKTQGLANASTQTVGYSYMPGGQIGTLTYPGGDQLSHVNDATGCLSGLAWKAAALVLGS